MHGSSKPLPRLKPANVFWRLFFGDEYNDDDPCCALSSLSIKWAGLAIPDPTTLAQPKYKVSISLFSHILAAFRGVDEFRSADCVLVIEDVKAELKLHDDAKNESGLDDLALQMSSNNCRTTLQGKETVDNGCQSYHQLSMAWNSLFKSLLMIF